MEHFCSVLLNAVTKGTIHVLCPMNMDVTILHTIYWYKVSCLQVVYNNEIARTGGSTVQIYSNSRCQDIFPMICGVSIFENFHWNGIVLIFTVLWILHSLFKNINWPLPYPLRPQSFTHSHTHTWVMKLFWVGCKTLSLIYLLLNHTTLISSLKAVYFAHVLTCCDVVAA